MSKQRKARQASVGEPVGRGGRPDRWEEKRRRFDDQGRGSGGQSRSLRPSTYITIGAIVLVVIFVALMTFSNSGPGSTSVDAVAQVTATSAATEGGRVSVSAEEVASKKLVAWDYTKGNVTTPLLAYVTPSGAMKIATRMCEPCNSINFHIEGNELVCNACGSRWDLETSRGISGGCQTYPPEVLPGSIVDGKLSVDEQKVATWKPRV